MRRWGGGLWWWECAVFVFFLSLFWSRFFFVVSEEALIPLPVVDVCAVCASDFVR